MDPILTDRSKHIWYCMSEADANDVAELRSSRSNTNIQIFGKEKRAILCKLE
jgi:hypothetical protein